MKIQTAFVPVLLIDKGITDIDFYKKAFGAIEHFRFCNDDSSVHVAELSIDGAMFHVHEEMPDGLSVCPRNSPGVTNTIGLMTEDVHAVYNQAIAAGAEAISPVQDFDYGYRQGDLKDPFGHVWTIQKKI